jgi:hypothetical protein
MRFSGILQYLREYHEVDRWVILPQGYRGSPARDDLANLLSGESP